jgi:hypothetical protein
MGVVSVRLKVEVGRRCREVFQDVWVFGRRLELDRHVGGTYRIAAGEEVVVELLRSLILAQAVPLTISHAHTAQRTICASRCSSFLPLIIPSISNASFSLCRRYKQYARSKSRRAAVGGLSTSASAEA